VNHAGLLPDGSAATDGAGGAGGGDRGGVAGTAGGGGTVGGASGASCAGFPQARSFVTPTDGLTHCYWVHREELDWLGSLARCASEQGTLASILSAQENAFVLDLVSDLLSPFDLDTRITLGGTDGKAADDRSGAGNYSWVSGEPWGYDDWNTSGSGGEPDGDCLGCLPNGLGCHCAHRLTMGPNGRWYDRWESDPRRFVCEAQAR